jgi:hypothetical protein
MEQQCTLNSRVEESCNDTKLATGEVVRSRKVRSKVNARVFKRRDRQNLS